MDTFLYREESTWIKVRFGGDMVWYRNVLFTETSCLILVKEKLVAGRAAKCKQERKAMTPVSFKVSSNQKYWPRLWFLCLDLERRY